MQPFDAVLLIAFGGPQGRDDIRPFLANVLRGRRVPQERIEEVAHHYELFDGISPLTELTNRQASALQAVLEARSLPLPVYVGMRNWHPYLRDTLARMADDGVRRAVGIVAAAHRSYSSCTQYRENVRDARHSLRSSGHRDVEVIYVGDWHRSDGFVAANAEAIVAAFERLPAAARRRVEIVFTAHSIPASMAERYPYERQIRESADAILSALSSRLTLRAGSAALAPDGADAASGNNFQEFSAATVVFQSRSGRPEDPWLEPDVCDYLRSAVARRVSGVVLCPVGFVCDHVEVLYDLDVEAAQVARSLDLALSRATAANDHPRFIDALADAVIATVARYRAGRPLEVVG